MLAYVYAVVDVSGEDNRDLLDDGKSQALTDDDIEVLKSEGLSNLKEERLVLLSVGFNFSTTVFKGD